MYIRIKKHIILFAGVLGTGGFAAADGVQQGNAEDPSNVDDVAAISPSVDHATSQHNGNPVDVETTLISMANQGIVEPYVVVSAVVPTSIAKTREAVEPVVVRWRRSPRPGNVSLATEWRFSNGTTKTLWVTFVVAEKHDVLVATRDIPKGATLSVTDMVMTRRAIDGKNPWKLPPHGLAGMKTHQAIKNGEIVTQDHVQAPAPLARGTEVGVVSQAGRVQISTKGKLEQSTRFGELTKVRLTNGHRLVEGTLMSGKIVMVHVGVK